MNIENCKERFNAYLLNYFGDTYIEKDFEMFKNAIKDTVLFFKDDSIGGWSNLYCKRTWNDMTLKNDADLEIFDLLFKIDLMNGAKPSTIIFWLCYYGAFEILKVR